MVNAVLVDACWSFAPNICRLPCYQMLPDEAETKSKQDWYMIPFVLSNYVRLRRVCYDERHVQSI
jgi:hypothetical protein